MKIGIVTDSTCELDSKILEKYNIDVVPLTIHFGEKTYKDGQELSTEEFYNKLLKSKENPNTSMPSPGLFEKTYNAMLENYDHLVSIHLSKELSGTYKSAKLAAKKFNGKITVLDSGSISSGLGMLTLLIAKMIEKGEKIDFIVETVKKAKNNLYLYFTVSDLTYLEQGGRIGKASSLIGSLFKINPIMSLNAKTGVVEPVSKKRGTARTQKAMINQINKKIKENQNCWLGFSHGKRSKELNEVKVKLLDKISDKNLKIKVFDSKVSATLGSHVGPSYMIILLTGDFLQL